jgi:hypothetical protein
MDLSARLTSWTYARQLIGRADRNPLTTLR